jgi:hypothetical protein
MNETQAERLEQRWLPVTDSSGRARMEATWVLVPVAASSQEHPGTHPVTHPATHAATHAA